MNRSVLELDNIALRPYSRKELKNIRYQSFRNLRIGKVMITHSECNHKYYARANGRKEKEVNEGISPTNCSVCWKINRTPRRLKNDAIKLTHDYISTEGHLFENPSSYEYVCLEQNFYTWLYTEFNPVNDDNKNTTV